MSKLISFREKLHLTQEEVAEKSGLSVRTIQRIERGTKPKGYTLRKLAQALGINENELLEAEETQEEKQEEVNLTLLKIINLSSLPFTFIPPVNILLPLLIMFAKKQFSSQGKQIVSIQILWTILSAIIFMLSSIVENLFSAGNKSILVVMILLILSNVFIILINSAGLDKSKKLRIRLNFNII
ncbi:MAG TPA: helix-turn-helix domain-containing protein [Pedobacter sp.]